MKSITTVVDDFFEFRIRVGSLSVEINFGQSFGLPKEEKTIQLNTTPRGDATFVPIEEAIIDDQFLLFRAWRHHKEQSYRISFAGCPFGSFIASFIKQFTNSELTVNPKLETDFHLRWESGNIYLSLCKLCGEKLSVFLPQSRATHLFRRHDGILRPDHFHQSSFTLQDSTLIITRKLEDGTFCPCLSWSVNFQAELRPFLLSVIHVCEELQANPRTIARRDVHNDAPAVEEKIIPLDGSSKKGELERLIAQEGRWGSYMFDDSAQCFLGDAEVGLYITRIGDEKFRSVCYFIDGHEVTLEDWEAQDFAGDAESAKRQAIDTFNRERFLGYPIVFRNISCSLIEDEK